VSSFLTAHKLPSE